MTLRLMRTKFQLISLSPAVEIMMVDLWVSTFNHNSALAATPPLRPISDHGGPPPGVEEAVGPGHVEFL